MARPHTYWITLHDENRNQHGHSIEVPFLPAEGMRLSRSGDTWEVIRVEIDLEEVKLDEGYTPVRVTVRSVR